MTELVPAGVQDLQELFYSFSAFGNRRLSKEQGICEMDGARFAKLAKDCKLLDKKFTATDVDLTFSKVWRQAQGREQATNVGYSLICTPWFP